MLIAERELADKIIAAHLIIRDRTTPFLSFSVRGGFCREETRGGGAGERREADADARTSGVQGDARDGELLPRLHGEVVARKAASAAER